MKLSKDSVGIIVTDKNGVTGMAVPKDSAKSHIKYDFKQVTKAKAIQRVKQYSGVQTLKEILSTPDEVLKYKIDYVGFD